MFTAPSEGPMLGARRDIPLWLVLVLLALLLAFQIGLVLSTAHWRPHLAAQPG